MFAVPSTNQVHGIGAVAAAKLVERGIRSLAHLREAVEKNQVHLDAAQELLTCFLRKLMNYWCLYLYCMDME